MDYDPQVHVDAPHTQVKSFSIAQTGQRNWPYIYRTSQFVRPVFSDSDLYGVVSSGENQEDIDRGEKLSAASTDYHSGHEHEAHSTNGLGNESRIENRGEYCRVHGTCSSDVLAWKKAVDALDQRDFASALK